MADRREKLEDPVAENMSITAERRVLNPFLKMPSWNSAALKKRVPRGPRCWKRDSRETRLFFSGVNQPGAGVIEFNG